MRHHPTACAARVRGAAAGSLTAALAVAAHAMAGGMLPSGPTAALLALLSLTLGTFVAVARRTGEFPVLVVVLAVGQALGHGLLGTAGHSHGYSGATSSVLMVAAHVVAVAVGGALIVIGDTLAAALSRALLAASPRRPQPVAAPRNTLFCNADQPLQSAHLLAASLSHRGPPVGLAT